MFTQASITHHNRPGSGGGGGVIPAVKVSNGFNLWKSKQGYKTHIKERTEVSLRLSIHDNGMRHDMKCLQVTLRRTNVRESSLWASCTSSQEKTAVRERIVYFLYSRQFLLTRGLFKFTISYPQSFILCWFSFVWLFLMQKYLVSLSSNKIFFMILKSIDKGIVYKRRKYWISLEFSGKFFLKVMKKWKHFNR